MSSNKHHLRKRRLPAPKLPPGAQFHPRHHPPPAPSADSTANRIVELIEAMAGTTQMGVHVIMRDWLGMIESSLKMWPAHLRTVALTGQLAEDPPEIQAIFSWARERYLRASLHRPAVYRQMQQSFAETFALLLESASPGLEQMAQQPERNPDIIGQVFITALDPGPASPWWHYFPTWSTTLTSAQEVIPNGDEWVYLALTKAALQAREDSHSIRLNPGKNFPGWFETIFPYLEPIVIGPPLVSSSTDLLAAAQQFPLWAIKGGLVKFTWDQAIEPLVLSFPE